MTVSADTIDRIVANVMSQLRSSGDGEARPAPQLPPASSPKIVTIPETVVTAEILETIASGSTVSVGPKAIVTPAGWDTVKARRLKIQRGANRESGRIAGQSVETAPASGNGLPPLLIVVRSTPNVDQLWTDLSGRWNRELLGCPDDAARLAISAICRGETLTVVILAEQVHRAACLSNRNDNVKGAAVTGPGDIKAVRKQLRANVWCVDPGQRSYFELKNIFREIHRNS
jgi:hypothetical protein